MEKPTEFNFNFRLKNSVPFEVLARLKIMFSIDSFNWSEPENCYVVSVTRKSNNYWKRGDIEKFIEDIQPYINERVTEYLGVIKYGKESEILLKKAVCEVEKNLEEDVINLLGKSVIKKL